MEFVFESFRSEKRTNTEMLFKLILIRIIHRWGLPCWSRWLRGRWERPWRWYSYLSLLFFLSLFESFIGRDTPVYPDDSEWDECDHRGEDVDVEELVPEHHPAHGQGCQAAANPENLGNICWRSHFSFSSSLCWKKWTNFGDVLKTMDHCKMFLFFKK